jgi:glutathione synthase/RimK-type ligase-like ATP-grasp enzyme
VESNLLLIVTADDDATTNYLEPALHRSGINFIRWDTGSIPTACLGSLHFDTELIGEIQGNFGRLQLDRVGCVYYRRPTAAHAPEHAETTMRQFINDEATHFCRAIIRNFRVPIVCDPRLASEADVKPIQHSAAQKVGFRVPETLYSNDPSAIRDFVRAAPDGAVVKTLTAPGVIDSEGNRKTILTRPIHEEELDIRALSQSVSIFQHRIKKDHELRVTVVGDEVYAVAIDASSSKLGQNDWRTYDSENIHYWRTELPKNVENMCLELVRFFGLHYGALDLIVTPEDEFVFLEINAFGQWAWLEVETGVPLTEAHCRLFKKLLN